MSVRSSDKLKKHEPEKRRYSWWMLVAIPAWVALAYIISNVIIVAVVLLVKSTGLIAISYDGAVFNTVLAALIYVLTLGITIFVPRKVLKKSTTKEELGLTRLPSWLDIVMTPAAAIVFFLITAIVMAIFTALFPDVNMNEAQDVGFNNLHANYEYVLAFITLIVLAPLAEEVLFRGYLYGKLRRYTPIWVAIIITSALFGFAHGQWNVGITTFALSIVLCGLRELTGSIWAGVLLHMLKNGVAFYFLFINPSIFTNLGG